VRPRGEVSLAGQDEHGTFRNLVAGHDLSRILTDSHRLLQIPTFSYYSCNQIKLHLRKASKNTENMHHKNLQTAFLQRKSCRKVRSLNVCSLLDVAAFILLVPTLHRLKGQASAPVLDYSTVSG